MNRNILLLAIFMPSAWVVSYIYELVESLRMSAGLIVALELEQTFVLKSVIFVESILLTVIATLPLIIVASILGMGKPLKIAAMALLGYFLSVSIYYYFNNTGFSYWYTVIAFTYTKAYFVLFSLVFLLRYRKEKQLLKNAA